MDGNPFMAYVRTSQSSAGPSVLPSASWFSKMSKFGVALELRIGKLILRRPYIDFKFHVVVEANTSPGIIARSKVHLTQQVNLICHMPYRAHGTLKRSERRSLAR